MLPIFPVRFVTGYQGGELNRLGNFLDGWHHRPVNSTAELASATSKQKTTDQVLRIYNRFCKKLVKLGLLRGRSEGAKDFAN